MATTQYPNIVPQGNKTQSLGTNAKKWRELFAGDIVAESVSGDAFAGGLLDIINALATKVELARVEGEVADAASPNYYKENEPFYADIDTNRTTIATPGVLWLNINDKGHKLTEQEFFDITNPRRTHTCINASPLAQARRSLRHSRQHQETRIMMVLWFGNA
jgi:hypothetical protein